MSLNRIVALLTPLAAALAGAVAAWLSQHFPGLEVDRDALEEIFIAGAVVTLAPAAQWLHGWQRYEARQAELQREVARATAGATDAGDWSEDGAEPSDALEALDPLDQLDESLLDEEDPAEAWS
jgi:hypothetical protein